MTSCRRCWATLAVCLLLFPVGLASAAEAITAEERGKIERVIQDYLLANPELMLEVFERVTRYQKDQESKRVRDNLVRLNDELYDDPNSAAVGSPTADVI